MRLTSGDATMAQSKQKGGLGCSLAVAAWFVFMFVVTVGVFIPQVNAPAARAICGEGHFNLDVYTEHPSRAETVTSMDYICTKNGVDENITLISLILSFLIYYGVLSVIVVIVTMVKNRGKTI